MNNDANRIDITLPLGTKLNKGRYTIERVLGSGGFGITYLCTDSEEGDYVAVKEFFPSSLCNRDYTDNSVLVGTASNTEIVERLRLKFKKEAKLILKLSSPYIVHLRGVFDENDTAYFAMDYIKGKTLAEIVKEQGPLSPEKAVEYISKVGDALTHIHQRNTNHLDVKPANIMVRVSDDTPVLIDFGLSKQYDEGGNQTSTTPVGISHGYAPMEQYNQSGVSNFSPQTDLYSLAATFLYAITGQTPPAASVVAEDGVPTHQIPKQFIAPITKAMSVKRADRHTSVRDFIIELHHALVAYKYDVPNSGNNDATTLSDNFGNGGGGNTGNFGGNAVNDGIIPPPPSVTPPPPGYTIENNQKPEKKFNKTILYVILAVLVAGGLVAAGFYFFDNDYRYSDDDYYSTDDTYDVEDSVETDALLEEQEVEVAEVDSMPVVAVADNYDSDNAAGYFERYARMYGNDSSMTYNGTISDSQGNHPILLTFDIYGDGSPRSCQYENVKYGNGYKIDLSVSFNEKRMRLYGSANGTPMEIDVAAGRDGQWSGYATLGSTRKPCYLYL